MFRRAELLSCRDPDVPPVVAHGLNLLPIVKSSVNGSSTVTTGIFVVEKIDLAVMAEMCVLTADGFVVPTRLLLSQQSFLSHDRNSCEVSAVFLLCV